MIGGNLGFGIGWWGANQSTSSLGKSCGKILQENLAGKSCGKFLWENLAGKSCGTGWRGKSQFKKGSDWWKFSIWNKVIWSQPIKIQLRKILWENLAGNAAGNYVGKLVENSVGISCGKILPENLWEILPEYLW